MGICIALRSETGEDLGMAAGPFSEHQGESST